MNRQTLVKILDLARWPPGGATIRPWRLKTVANDRVAVYGFDTRNDVAYEFEGYAIHIAFGALLETRPSRFPKVWPAPCGIQFDHYRNSLNRLAIARHQI